MKTSTCSALPWHDLLIAKKLVEIARKEGATAICHGATGKGNDQIRFELGIKALAPDIKIIAAWRNDKWTMDSRESEIEYCKAHGIHLPFSADSSYSRDRNIWHISHEGLELEDPANEPNFEHLLVLGTTPEKAPDQDEYVTMTFEKGVPTSVNGKKMKVSEIITTLNELGGKHGIGIIDIVENRVVGMKSRGVYETPGGTILMEAHQQLEELILDRDTYAMKKEIGSQLCKSGIRGQVVHTSPSGGAGIHRGDTEVCHRRGKVQALQGQYHQGRNDLSLLSVQREHRFLHDR